MFFFGFSFHFYFDERMPDADERMPGIVITINITIITCATIFINSGDRWLIYKADHLVDLNEKISSE